MQLHALRSAGSWGIGDLGDLRALGEWASADLGARVSVINPLHAATPVLPQEPSPYRPSSRRYLSPLYVRIEEAPGPSKTCSESRSARTCQPPPERNGRAGAWLSRHPWRTYSARRPRGKWPRCSERGRERARHNAPGARRGAAPGGRRPR
ncbi:MAG: 4-alpha-glucanotransferase [Candidatus Rokubacteria bacterium]|nr:4-alpha-glucanotransferase [Candidatus Rokubacteria bacterium]